MTTELPEVTPAPPALSPVPHAVVSALTGLTFALLATWGARQGAHDPVIDDRVHRWVVSHRSPGSTAFARAVTWGGVAAVALPSLVIIGAIADPHRGNLRGRLKAGALLAGVAGIGFFAGLRFNAAFARERPALADWTGTAGGPGFPSGHTTTGTLFAASCAWALAARARPGWPRVAVWGGAVAYSAAVGWSRVWLGVHWPLDVVGGWLFGLSWFSGTMAAILMVRRKASARRGEPGR